MSISLRRELPFYPTYDLQVQNDVTIWWFIADFSQSRYNFKHTPSGSNACTLITLLLAFRCYSDKIQIASSYTYELNPTIIGAFAECVLEGNEIHEKLRKSGALENVNLTVPEAICSLRYKMRNITEWRSILYMSDLGETLFKHLKDHVSEWYRTSMYKYHRDLYVILIADHRSVLFVFQDKLDKISLLDSHQHKTHGALIAQVPRFRLKSLCHWYHLMINDYFDSQPNCYELSFLYFKM